jgi:hypothetical protein
MANLVFTPCTGTVEIKRDADCGGSFFDITLDGEKLNGSGAVSGIVTGLSLTLNGHYQFVHTVNNFVYFYAFGDRIGTLSITGLGFVVPCGGASLLGGRGQILTLYEKYVAKRAARRGGEPMQLTLSGGGTAKTFLGFLTGLTLDIKSSEAIGTVGYWNMKFDVLLDDGASSGGTTSTGG